MRDQMTVQMQLQIEACRAMVEMLEKEHTALEGRDAESIQTTSEAKNAVLDRINTLDSTRNQILSSLSISQDGSGMARFIKQFDPSSSGGLLTLWTELHELAERCQKLNQINGTVIELSRRNAQRAMDIISGRSATDSGYDPEGNELRGTNSRHITSV